jgi:alpha-amylase/alpha-mannosidase (GH57 family)
VSEITWEKEDLVFAVLHLGGWDFHCCIQPFEGRRSYSQIREQLFTALQQASAAHVILVMTQLFGQQDFSLQNLFAEERHRLMRLLSQETLTRLDQLYTQTYRDNYGIIMAFHRDGIAAPQELQVAAEIALGQRCMAILKALEQEITEPQATGNHLSELEALATEAKHLQCKIDTSTITKIFEQLIMRSLWQLLHDSHDNLAADIKRLERLINVGNQLNLGVVLEKSQELYFHHLHQHILPECAHQQDTSKYRQLLNLGKILAVDVTYWLAKLASDK